MTRIKIDSVTVGKRRRETLGDLRGLMASIQKFELWHPIVVTDDRALVAGQRRLESCRRLGHKMIEVRYVGDLSENELREIELDENLQRKDLTAHERSRVMVELAETAADVITTDEDVLRDSRKTKGGRPVKKKTSQKAVSERTGIAQQDLSKAERHVTACDKYPFLKDVRWKQSPALKMAKLLDAIKPAEVKFLLGCTGNGSGGNPKVIRQFFETWKDSSSSSRQRIRDHLKGPSRGQTISLLAGLSPSADESLMCLKDMRRTLAGCLRRRPKDDLNVKLEKVATVLEEAEVWAVAWNKKHIERLRKELLK